MTLSKIPHQQILKTLYIKEASPDSKLSLSVQELIDKKLYQMGDLETLPASILDNVITFLDTKTAFDLKFTYIAFRVLVQENLHQSVQHMPRFFALASRQILTHSSSKDEVAHAIAAEHAKRGDLVQALQDVDTVNSNNWHMRDRTFRKIAKAQALRGDVDEAQATLKHCMNQLNQLDAYVIIARNLAKKGEDTHALAFADRIPLFNLGRKRQAYTDIACAQVSRGQWSLALATIEVMYPDTQEEALNKIHEEREKQVRLANALKNPEQVQDPTEKDSVYHRLTANLAKEGKFQAAFTSALSIKELNKRNAAYKDIAEAQITQGDLPAAFKTLNAIVEGNFYKRMIYALIGKAYAQKGDFKNCLETLNLIIYDANRAKAYQQVVTVLSSAGL